MNAGILFMMTPSWRTSCIHIVGRVRLESSLKFKGRMKDVAPASWRSSIDVKVAGPPAIGSTIRSVGQEI